MTMLRVIRQFFQISANDYSDDEILHICGVLFVNSHEIPVTATPCQAIYRNASLVEHSCVNNASKHFDMNCNIQVRTHSVKRGLKGVLKRSKRDLNGGLKVSKKV